MTAKGNPTGQSTAYQGWIKTALLLGLLTWSIIILMTTQQTFHFQPAHFALLFKLKRFGPVDSALFISHWLETSKLLISLTAMLLTAYGLGSYLTKKTGLTDQKESGYQPLVDLVLALAFGLAAMSLLAFFIGVLQLNHQWLVVLLTTTGALGGGLTLWQQRHHLRTTKIFTGIKISLLDGLLVGVTGLVMLFIIIHANAPETFYDSLVYHLAVPQQYIIHHGIKALPTIFFSNMPFGIEMLYAWSLLLADERLCHGLHVVLGLLTAVMIFITARKFCQPVYALWAACLFLLIPVVTMNMMRSGADVGAAFFAVLAFYALLTWMEKSVQPQVAIAWNQTLSVGLLIGMALLCKYTTAFILAPAVLISLILVARGRQVHWHLLVKPLLWMSAGVLLLLAPLFIKNAVLTNNPVYPFLFNLIPSKHVHPEKMQNQMHEFKEFGKRTIAQYVKQPWQLTFYQPTSNSFIGVVFLFILPVLMGLSWLNRRGPPRWQLLIWSVVAGSLIWSTQTQIMRYYIPMIPLLCVLTALAIERWINWQPLAGMLTKIVVISLAAWCAGLFMTIEISNHDQIGVALGREARARYLERKLMNSYTNMADQINRLPDKSKIMIYGDARSYYYQQSVTVATVFDQHPLIAKLQAGQTAEQIWQSLRAQHYTHVMVHHSEAQRTRGYEVFDWQEKDITTYQQLVSQYLNPVAIHKQQILYEVMAQPQPEQPVKPGRPLFTESFPTVNQVRMLLSQNRRPTSNWQAIKNWERVRALVPQWWVPYHMLGWYYYQLKQPEKALQLYMQAESLGWLDPNGYYILASHSAQKGNFILARKYFLAALQQAPDFSQAQRGLEQVNRLMEP